MENQFSMANRSVHFNQSLQSIDQKLNSFFIYFYSFWFTIVTLMHQVFNYLMDNISVLLLLTKSTLSKSNKSAIIRKRTPNNIIIISIQ